MNGLRGLSAGLAPFYITVSVEVERDGWTGGKQYPSFWTVGGYPIDAIRNARRILGVAPGDSIDPEWRRFTVSATLATVSDTAPLTVSWDSLDNVDGLDGSTFTVRGSYGGQGMVWHTAEYGWRASVSGDGGSQVDFRTHTSGMGVLADLAARFAASPE